MAGQSSKNQEILMSHKMPLRHTTILACWRCTWTITSYNLTITTRLVFMLKVTASITQACLQISQSEYSLGYHLFLVNAYQVALVGMQLWISSFLMQVVGQTLKVSKHTTFISHLTMETSLYLFTILNHWITHLFIPFTLSIKTLRSKLNAKLLIISDSQIT